MVLQTTNWGDNESSLWEESFVNITKISLQPTLKK